MENLAACIALLLLLLLSSESTITTEDAINQSEDVTEIIVEDVLIV